MTFILLVSIVTSLSILLIFYYHLGYPFILKVLSGRKKSKINARRQAFQPVQQSLPSVTILVTAHNQERSIVDKIRNLSILDYPQNKLKIIIVNDGSTDRTYEFALATLNEEECQHFSIKVVNYECNVGRVDVLNGIINGIATDIVALSDVTAIISIDALLVAVKHFNDPEIGVVNGSYQVLSSASGGKKSLRERHSKVRADEANVGSMIGSCGAFYLIRTHLYQSLPADTINDDFVIPMQAVQKGYRSVYDSETHALGFGSEDSNQKRIRDHRVSEGKLQQIFRLRSLLLPRYKGTAFTFASSGVLNVLMPYLLIIAFLGSLLLVQMHPVFMFLAVGQALLYVTLIVSETTGMGRSCESITFLNYLLKEHLSCLLGAMRYLKNKS